MIISLNGYLSDEENFAMFAALLGLIAEKPGPPDRDIEIKRSIFNLLYHKLGNYVPYQLRTQRFSCRGEDPDALIDAAWAEIISAFHRYNGRYRLTTFAKPLIIAGAWKQIAAMDRTDLADAIPLRTDHVHATQDVEGTVMARERSREIADALKCLTPMETYIISLYSGIWCGYGGKKHTLDMICADDMAVRLIRAVSPGRIISGPFTYPCYDADRGRYIRQTRDIEHVSPSYMKRTIARIRKKCRCLLMGQRQGT